MSEAETQWESQWTSTMMNNYGTPPVELVSGAGSRLLDYTGKEYIDFLAGIAVNSLGHAHPDVVQAITQQAQTLGHVSNLFAHQPGLDLAKALRRRFIDAAQAATLEGPDPETVRVAFCNSGTEANEMAFKLSRLTGRPRILAAVHGFHGRTMGSLAMTGQPAKRDIFAPLPGGVEYFPYNDAEYLEKLIAVQPEAVAAVILEPIQGETGVIPADREFLQAVRRLTTAAGALLIIDEVQTGNGRTGTYWAFEDAGIIPDVVTTAKGLAAGLPIGACLAAGPAAGFFTPGAHGSTFAGNPIVAAAAGVVQKHVDAGLLEQVASRGEQLAAALKTLDAVVTVRGRGLMLGAVLDAPIAKKVVAAALEQGVICNAPSETVLRFTPPLTITEAEIDEGVARLAAAIAQVKD